MSGVPRRGSIPVMLCCNDEHGVVDQLLAVSFGDDPETLSLEGDPEDGEKIEFVDGFVRIDGMTYRVKEHSKYVGNIMWDRVMMVLDDAVVLANALRAKPHWQCTVAETNLYQAFRNRNLAADDLLAAIIKRKPGRL